MKQYKSILLVSLASFFFLAGCQKDFIIEGGDPNPPGFNDSVYLERVTESYSGMVDSIIHDFRYDNQKRVIGISRKLYRNYILEDTSVTTFYYNGSDTVPFKYTDYLANVTVSYFDSSTRFFFYDAQGRIGSDSTINAYGGISGYSKEKQVGTYQYSGNNIYYYRTQSDLLNPAAPFTYYKDTIWRDANKNMVKWHAYEDLPQFLFYTEDNTFDNKLNPYYYTNIPDHHGLNNILTTRAEKIFSPGSSSVYNVIFVHTYNAFNMPTLSVGTDIGNSSVDRIYYKYRSL